MGLAALATGLLVFIIDITLGYVPLLSIACIVICPPIITKLRIKAAWGKAIAGYLISLLLLAGVAVGLAFVIYFVAMAAM